MPRGDPVLHVATVLIAVPTGVKVFNWLATCGVARWSFETPMLFAVGFIFVFTMGGSPASSSRSCRSTSAAGYYYVVAHFHYVLVAGSLFSLLPDSISGAE